MKLKKIIIKRDNQRIVGTLLIPKKISNSLIIISPGLGKNISAKSFFYAAKQLCEKNNYIFIFDFIGGSNICKSDGKTYEMSVFTEVKDLTLVLKKMSQNKNYKKISLLGFSQGGLVSSIVAAKKSKLISNLILFYPAFSIPNIVKKKSLFIPTFLMPKKFKINGIWLGPIFVKDARKLKIWKSIKKYQNRVVIFYGDNDKICTNKYIQKAMSTYKNIRVYKYLNTGHAFSKKQTDSAVKTISLLL
jgi:uncharacterized protein